MNFKTCIIVITMLIISTGCSSTSKSNLIAPGVENRWEGPVFVSQTAIPDGIEYKVIGSVEADARAGYGSVDLLYPLLAKEAKKIGANAVMNAKGGRKVTAFSWSAPYVDGIAVKVEDPEKLKGLSGAYY